MNKLYIIGNLTKDPEKRQVNTAKGPVDVCEFTVATNDRRSKEATYFHCSAWRGLAGIVSQYASKGKKVAIIGSVGAHAYTTNDGKAQAVIDVTVDDLEFLSPRGEAFDNDLQGMTAVKDEDMPF